MAEIVRYPVEKNDISKYALGIGVLIALDKPLTRIYQDKIETSLSGFSLTEAPGRFKDVGTGNTDGWLVLGLAGSCLSGVVLTTAGTKKQLSQPKNLLGVLGRLSKAFLKQLLVASTPCAHRARK